MTKDIWSNRAKALLEEALGEWDDLDPIPKTEAAVACIRIAFGELPEDEMAHYFEEPECACPPELVARGGFKSNCPAHGTVKTTGG